MIVAAQETRHHIEQQLQLRVEALQLLMQLRLLLVQAIGRIALDRSHRLENIEIGRQAPPVIDRIIDRNLLRRRPLQRQVIGVVEHGRAGRG